MLLLMPLVLLVINLVFSALIVRPGTHAGRSPTVLERLEDTHEHGVGFPVHKNTVNCVMTCYPISSRLITICLRASPFNITIIQVYAPTSNYSDDDVEHFYEELQKVLDKTPKKDIVEVQGDWNAKIGEEACKDWKGTCGHHCNNKIKR